MSMSNTVVIYSIFLLISSSAFTRKSLILAQPTEGLNGQRPDPLNHFKHYNGSYDVRNNHYWASAAFTGIHGYAIAGIWLLLGIGYGCFKIARSSTNGSPVDHPASIFVTIFSLVLFFTLICIVLTILSMAVNIKWIRKTTKVKETVFQAGDNTFKTIGTVINEMDEMQTILTPYDPDTVKVLNSVSTKLGTESGNVKGFVKQTRRSTNHAVQIMYTTNIVFASLNLVLLIVASVLLVTHWYPGVLLILFCCWILTTCSWILTGLDYFFHTFMQDTCHALDEYGRTPENSSLHIILSCDTDRANEILSKVGLTVHNFIVQLNKKIGEFKGLLSSFAGDKPDLLGIDILCDPFSSPPNYTYTPDICKKDTTPVGDVPKILSKYICPGGSSVEICLLQMKFVPQSLYYVIAAYSQSIQVLMDVYPDVINLANCSDVKKAFNDIRMHQCKPLKQTIQILWSLMLSLSVFMVVLTILWAAKTSEDRGRKFTMCSIVPEPLENSILPTKARIASDSW